MVNGIIAGASQVVTPVVARNGFAESQRLEAKIEAIAASPGSRDRTDLL
jgi:hypothetical protein